MQIKIKYFEGARKLSKIDKGDWIDLYSNEEVPMIPGQRYVVPLGVAMELPEGYEAIVAPRSSTFKTWGVLQTNSIGVIDESYKGDNDEWCMSVYATREETIHKGDKICQFRIQEKMPPITFVEVSSLDNPDRGGFGSTGKV